MNMISTLENSSSFVRRVVVCVVVARVEQNTDLLIRLYNK